MNGIFTDKFVYHVYPLGLAGSPKHNDYSCAAGSFFETFVLELGRLESLGVNALLIGPVFESSSHGYDTVDYFHIDRRLGNNEKFREFCHQCHQHGISVILDAVFNHTGRDFFAFKDLIQNGWNSSYKDWYLNINFSGRSCYGDCFDYEGWAGCKELVKLNGDNPAVQEHIFSAVEMWIRDFEIDGLRLDAADVLSKGFMDCLSSRVKALRPGFWLMGEVVHGNYNDWVRPGRLDSVTNYQIYKSLWSAVNDKNMHELSWNLDREFSAEGEGLYRNLPLFNFIDNHDVNRIASTVKNQCDLYLLYALLFTIPGVPSVYYGSEWGIRGMRGKSDDYQLRPCLPPYVPTVPDFATPQVDSSNLFSWISKLASIRKENFVLQQGSFKKLFVTGQAFAFERSFENNQIIVCINCGDNSAFVNINNQQGVYENLLTGKDLYSNDLKNYTLNPKEIIILRRKQ